MRIKSYFSASVEAAISQARRELGPDAVLVSTRSAPPEAAHLGRYEVVFGSLEQTTNTADSKVEDGGSYSSVRSPMMEELAELRKQIEELCQTVGQTNPQRSSRFVVPDRFVSCLTDNGLSLTDARSVAHAAAERMAAEGTAAGDINDAVVLRLIAAELESRVRVTGGLPGAAQRTVVAFVGPAGVGKTDMLAKIAVSEGLARNRPVRLLSTDCERVASSARLQCFATILGMPLQTCESPALVEAALRKKQERELVLIDTPGYTPSDIACARELGNYFCSAKEIRTVLVLPATMKAEDMLGALERFTLLGPKELVFTHLDESRSFGSIWTMAAASKLPISFFGTGQQIPDDLEAATLGKLSFLLLRGSKERAASNAA